MKVKTKQVYYCDYCRKHGLLGAAMLKHEQHCTMNPERFCRWNMNYRPNPPQEHDRDRSLPDLIEWAKGFETFGEEQVGELHDSVEGCPACMLTVIRLSRQPGEVEWSYKDEIEAFNQALREEEYYSEMRDIERAWR